jgi:hypothetical protein
LGEEVAEYNGAYKASKGMLDEFGPKRVIDTPIAELGFAGDVQAAVVASDCHFARGVEGPAALGVFCNTVSLNSFA